MDLDYKTLMIIINNKTPWYNKGAKFCRVSHHNTATLKNCVLGYEDVCNTTVSKYIGIHREWSVIKWPMNSDLWPCIIRFISGHRLLYGKSAVLPREMELLLKRSNLKFLAKLNWLPKRAWIKQNTLRWHLKPERAVFITHATSTSRPDSITK